jgi:hypothetical protein
MAGLTVELRVETADLRDPPLQVAAVTFKAEVPVAHKSRPVIDDPIGGVLAGRVKTRPGGVAALPVEIRTETTDPGYSPREVAAVTPKAPAWIAYKRRSVINNPTISMFSG